MLVYVNLQFSGAVPSHVDVGEKQRTAPGPPCTPLVQPCVAESSCEAPLRLPSFSSLCSQGAERIRGPKFCALSKP